MRDFDPAYDRFGSFTTDAVEARRSCLSAFAESRQIAVSLGMSALCQLRTHAPQQTTYRFARLFDRFVGAWQRLFSA
jgi:hypothetical protein